MNLSKIIKEMKIDKSNRQIDLLSGAITDVLMAVHERGLRFDFWRLTKSKSSFKKDYSETTISSQGISTEEFTELIKEELYYNLLNENQKYIKTSTIGVFSFNNNLYDTYPIRHHFFSAFDNDSGSEFTPIIKIRIGSDYRDIKKINIHFLMNDFAWQTNLYEYLLVDLSSHINRQMADELSEVINEICDLSRYRSPSKITNTYITFTYEEIIKNTDYCKNWISDYLFNILFIDLIRDYMNISRNDSNYISDDEPIVLERTIDWTRKHMRLSEDNIIKLVKIMLKCKWGVIFDSVENHYVPYNSFSLLLDDFLLDFSSVMMLEGSKEILNDSLLVVLKKIIGSYNT